MPVYPPPDPGPVGPPAYCDINYYSAFLGVASHLDAEVVNHGCQDVGSTFQVHCVPKLVTYGGLTLVRLGSTPAIHSAT